MNGVCSAPATPGAMISPVDGSLHVVLTNSSSVTWTLDLHIPMMPDSYFMVGDAYDLSFSGSIDTIFYTSVNQTLTSRRRAD